MQYTYLMSVLYAVVVLGSPILDTRNLPDELDHQHNHMDFHKHELRDEDTPAERLLDALEDLGFDNPLQEGQAHHEEHQPPKQGSTPVYQEPPSVPVPVVTVYVEQQEAPPPKPVEHHAPPPKAHHQPKPHSQPPHQPPHHVNPQPTPPKQKPSPKPAPKPSPKPSPANPLSGMPSAPAEFVEDLNPDGPVYKALVLLHHNIHRANHSLPPLEWNETLFEFAKNSAQSCVYAHTSPVPPYGQNIAAGNAPGNVSADITNGFYNGEIGLFHQAIGEFGNDTPDMALFEEWGHATQILWRDTTSVACYTASCAPSGSDPIECGPQGSYLKNVGCGNGGTRAFNLVCNYYPPGNYANKYSAVPPPADLVGFVQMTGEGVIGLPKNL